VDVHSAPVELLHRVKRGNLHHRRMLQRSASSHHHGNQQRRGPAHPLQASSVYRHHPLAPDKPLSRRKRIRRDGSTPPVTIKQTPASEQALASHRLTAHRRPWAELLHEKPQPKPGNAAGKTHRRKVVRRRGRGHSLPNHLIGLASQHQGYGDDHARNRKTSGHVKRRRGNEMELVAHHHKQKEQLHPLASGDHHQMYRARPGKTPVSQPGKRRVSTSSVPDSLIDKIHSHPAAIPHAGVLPRRQKPVSSSGQRRRRISVARKSADSSRHAAPVGLEGSRFQKHGITTARRRGIGPRSRISDG